MAVAVHEITKPILQNNINSNLETTSLDDVSNSGESSLSKAAKVAALTSAGTILAGPAGGIAGGILAMSSETEAKKRSKKTKKSKTTSKNKKISHKEVSDEEFLLIFKGVLYGNGDIVKRTLYSIKNYPKLFEKLLTRTDEKGRFILFYYSGLGKVELVKIMLDSVKDNPELFEKVLTQTDKEGGFALFTSSNHGKHEVVEVILDSVKDNPEIFEKVLTQKDKEGRSALFVASLVGRVEVVTAILRSVENQPELLNKLVKYKPKTNKAPFFSTLQSLIVSGNQKSLEIIIKNDPEIILDKLPNLYISDIPNTAIYYLEAFLDNERTNNQNKINIQYFNENEGILTEKSIDNITLRNEDPILIKLNNHNNKQETVILNEVNAKYENTAKTTLKNTINLAVNNKISNVFLNFNIMQHVVTAKFSKNHDKPRSKWNLEVHDPNVNGKEEYTQVIKKLCQEAGIEVKTTKSDYRLKDDNNRIIDNILYIIDPTTGQKYGIKNKDIIIPNYGSNSIEGSCDIISSIVASSMIADKIQVGHSKELRSRCTEIGANCVEEIAKELNPKIDKILERRLQTTKDRISPSSSVESPKSQKVQQQNMHNEL